MSFKFFGGVHPNDKKAPANKSAIVANAVLSVCLLCITVE